MTGSLWFTAAAIRVETLSRVASIASVFSAYSLASAGRRDAFGLRMASHDSASSAVNAWISRFSSGSRVFCSENSTEARASAADRIAEISASRWERRYFCTFGCSMESSFRLRLVVDLSLRRLCIALNRFAEASATTEIRLVAASRPHELQALTLSKAVIQTAIRTMTDLISEDTVRRSSIGGPRKARPLRQKRVNF